jgi:general stress protein 26
MQIEDGVISFFEKQGFAIFSTLDLQGSIHCSAKGIIKVEPNGRVYLMDLYKSATFNNLKANPTASVTAVDERAFRGYTLKGKAKIIEKQDIQDPMVKKWEEKLVSRITARVVKSIRDEKRSFVHPEAGFPLPEYLICMEVESLVDLAPGRR